MEGTRQAPAAAAPPAAPGRANGGTPATVEAKSGPNPTVRLLLIVVAVIVLLVAIVYGVRFLAYATTHETTDDATIDADEIQITSKISERVDHIFADTNQRVRKGELLVQLDDRDERDRYNQARAAFDAQRAQARAAQENVNLTRDTQQAQNLENSGGIQQAQASISSVSEQAKSSAKQIAVSEAGVDSARSQLEASRAGVPGALQSLRKAAADLARTQSLVSTGDEATQQLDAVRAEEATAAAQLRDAQNQIHVADAQYQAATDRVAASSAGVLAAQGGVTTAQGKLDQASDPSQVESARAQLDLARQNLAYTNIYSAIDGYVGEKNAEIGQVVSAGMNLMTLIPHHVYITANFKETQMGSIKVGQPADIAVDAYKGVTFHGHVTSINPASQNTYALVPAQNATGNFVKVTQRIPVRISIDDPRSDMPLRPGMSVEANVAKAK